MRGSIAKRGKHSWRIRFDTGNGYDRQVHSFTVKGTKQDAQKALAAALSAHHGGTLVDPSKVTVGEYVCSWLAGAHLSPKTAERYRELVSNQIVPHLGAVPLQKLKPADMQRWHQTLLKSGSKDGQPLAARTVGHAHRVLHRALAEAARTEVLARNVASLVHPPKADAEEIEILTAPQKAEVVEKLRGHVLYPIVVLALATGMRRGELLALQWRDADLDTGIIKVERSLEQTRAGLRIKLPKTRHGRRAITLPTSAVETLRAHRKDQLELRLRLGLGAPTPDGPIFSTIDGRHRDPNGTTREWARLVESLKLPRINFHALRHTHASQLIAAGVDILTVSRRLGHASPTITLNVYGHLFTNTDAKAAAAIDAALRG